MTSLPAENSYRDSRWRDAHEFEQGAIVCEETGALAVAGVCPVHGGDACLYSSALLLAYWRERFLGSGGSGEPTQDLYATIDAQARNIDALQARNGELVAKLKRLGGSGEAPAGLTRERLADAFTEAMDTEAELAGFGFTQHRDTPAFNRVIDHMLAALRGQGEGGG